MKCNKCGYVNAISSKFCADCGTKLDVLKCEVCDSNLTKKTKFCTECGTKNPFYKEIVKPVPKVVVKPVISSKSSQNLKKENRLVPFVFVVGISLITLIFSLGKISETRLLDYDWETDDHIQITFTQSAFKMYKGYYDALGITSETAQEDYFDGFSADFLDVSEDYGSTITASEYGEILTSLDMFGANLVGLSDVNHPFMGTIEFLPSIVLLLLIEIIPLIIITIALLNFDKKKSMANTKPLFLLGGILGVLLAFSLQNISEYATYIGSGLKTYTIIMFIVFGLMQISDMWKSDKSTFKNVSLYFINIAVVTTLLIIVNGAFLKVGAEYSSNRYEWGSIDYGEFAMTTNVFQEDFVYSVYPDFYGASEPTVRDDGLSPDDREYNVKNYDYSFLFAYLVFDDENTQDQFILSTLTAIYALVVGVSIFSFLTLMNSDKYLTISKVILKILVLGLFIGTLLLGINAVDAITNSIEQQDTILTVEIPKSIYVAIATIAANLILDTIVFFRSKKNQDIVK